MSPKGGGERPMVPRAEPRSYYGLPVLNAPVWRHDIPAYFFLGGLAGASSVLAAGAQATGRATLARRTKLTAVGALAAGAAALVHDLGRPDRFHHMLRVFKPTSPMSIGSWLLAAYGPATGVAAVSALGGRAPRSGAAATALAAALGPPVTTYTAAILSDTAVPAWHEAHRQLPFVFGASAAVAAGGAALCLSPRSEAAPARRLAVLGAAAELAATKAMEDAMGLAGEAYRSGQAGRWLGWSRRLTASGVALALVGRGRATSAVAGALLVGASALTRFGVVEAGKQSAADPAHTVAPQRSRLAGAGGA